MRFTGDSRVKSIYDNGRDKLGGFVDIPVESRRARRALAAQEKKKNKKN